MLNQEERKDYESQLRALGIKKHLVPPFSEEYYQIKDSMWRLKKKLED